MQKTVVVVAWAFGLAGCAIGQKVDYRHQSVALNAYSGYDSSSRYTIGVLDTRGDEEHRVGTLHSLVGIPWAITTSSEQPLADDLAASIVDALQRNQVPTVAATIRAGTSVAEARKLVTPKKGDIGVLLTMKEFFSRSWFATNFTFDMVLEVIDSHGSVLASSEEKGDSHADMAELAQLSSSAITRLFLNQDVRKVIQKLGSRSPPTISPPEPEPSIAAPPAEEKPLTPLVAPTPPSDGKRRAPLGASRAEPDAAKPAQPPLSSQKCSVDQVLKLKELKMSDDQIKAACQ